MEAAVRPSPTRTNGTEQPVVHPFGVADPTLSPALRVSAASGVEQTNGESSSTATLPRLTSVQVSNNGSQDRPWDTTAESQLPSGADTGPSAGAGAGVSGADGSATRRSSSSFSGDILGPEDLGTDQEAVVLTPSRLRLDSRVVFAHATLQWLTNAIWAVLIWQKLEGRIVWSWWGVFAPTFLNHTLHVPMHLIVLAKAERMVYLQIGPPPPPTASPGLVLHYAILRAVRLRSHRVDAANNALESAALLVVKLLFCNALARGQLASTSLRVIFTPIWVVWGLSVLLLCFKDRSERMFGSSRDLFFIFLLFVAFKVDDASSYSWRVVFLVPWMWFSGLLLVAALVLLLLLFARCWSRPRELLLPLGFCCLLLSCLPQFVSYIALVRLLDGDTGTSIASILWPNALSWLLMWLSGCVLAVALRAKEAVREALLARGAVWTAHAAVARRLTAEREEATRRVEALSEEEVSRLVESMMAGKSKPGRLRRVGATLYKRIASLEPALAEQAAQVARMASGSGAAAGGGSGRFKPPSRPASHTGLPLAPLPPRAASAMPQLGTGAGLGRGLGGVAAAGASQRPSNPRPGLQHNHSLPPLRPASAAPAAAPGPGPAPVSLGLPPKRNRVLPTGGSGSESAAGAAASGEEPSTRQAAGGPSAGVSGRWLVGSEEGSAPATGAATLTSVPPGDGEILPVLGAEAAPLGSGADLELERAGSSFRIGTRPMPDGATEQDCRAGRAAAASAAAGMAPAAAELGTVASGPNGGSAAAAAWRPTSAPPGSSARGGSSGAKLWWTPHGLARGPGAHAAAALVPGQKTPGTEDSAVAEPARALPDWDTAASNSTAAHNRTNATAVSLTGIERDACASGSPSQAAVSPSSPRRSPAALLTEEVSDEVAALQDQGQDQAGGGSCATAPGVPRHRRSTGGATPGAEAVAVGTTEAPRAAPAAGDQTSAAAAAAAGAADGSGGEAAANAVGGEADLDDNACVICYDGEARCVFLECGHGGFCRRCAYLLFVRPPNECPTCRATIEQVVEIEDVAPVGQVARVK